MDRKWLVFIGLALAIMMVDLDITATNLAISKIISELKLSISNGQWVIDGYSMSAAVLMAFGGRCGDRYGHRKIMFSALCLFAFASLAVGMSCNSWSIILSRLLQGACVAFTFPLATVIVRQIFPAEQRGFAIGLLISIAGISQAIGPSFGASMITLASWRLIFLVNVPLAIIALLLIRLINIEHEPTSNTKLDIMSLMFLVVGLFSLLTGLNEINRFGILSIPLLSLLFIAIISLAVFTYKEVKGNKPLLDLKLLLDATFSTLITTRLIVNFVYFGWLFSISLLLQKHLHYSIFMSGLIMLSLTAVTAILAAPIGKLLDKVGCKKPLLIGLLLMLLSCLLIAQPWVYSSQLGLILSLIACGFSISLLVPSTAVASIKSVSMQKAGAAMGVLFTCGFLGNALGVAVTGSLLAHYGFASGFSYALIFSSVLTLLSLLLIFRLPAKI